METEPLKVERVKTSWFRHTEQQKHTKLLLGVAFVLTAVGAGSLGFILRGIRPALPGDWPLQVTVFLAVAILPGFAVDWIARGVVRVGEHLKPADHAGGFRNPGTYLGLVERPLFLGALVASYPEFIAVWFLFKSIAGWKTGGTDITAGRRFQVTLLNNAVSLAGVALGWMLWKLLGLPTLAR